MEISQKEKLEIEIEIRKILTENDVSILDALCSVVNTFSYLMFDEKFRNLLTQKVIEVTKESFENDDGTCKNIIESIHFLTELSLPICNKIKELHKKG